MPRLSQSAYIAHHHVLRRAWLHDRDLIFPLLTATEQWQLHEYYLPTIDLIDEGMREYRRRITLKDPILPNRAGKTFAKLLRLLDEQDDRAVAAAVKVSPTKKRRHRSADSVITIQSLAHPTPDAEKLARTLLDMAKAMAKKAKKNEQIGHDDRAAKIDVYFTPHRALASSPESAIIDNIWTTINTTTSSSISVVNSPLLKRSLPRKLTPKI